MQIYLILFNASPIIKRFYSRLFNQFLIEGYLGYFQFSIIKNNSIISSFVDVSLGHCAVVKVQIEYISESRIAFIKGYGCIKFYMLPNSLSKDITSSCYHQM